MKKLSQSKYTPLVTLLFAIISCIMVYTFRFVWVFVNIEVKIESFMMIVLCVMMLNAFAAGILSVVKLYGINFKGYKVSLGITLVLTVLSTIIGIVYAVIAGSRESSGAAFEYFKDSLLKISLFVFVPLIAIIFPSLSQIAKKIAITITLVCVLAFGFISLFPISSYEITSAPAVIDNGEEYSVVFATTDKGTGFVTYTFEGKEYKLYDSTGGRMNSDSKIHSIAVPYEHLKNNTYKVGSVRIIEGYSYGSHSGKQVISEEYTFNVNESKSQTYLTISDWHTNLDGVYGALSYIGDYDGVILMGDASPGLDFEGEAVSNIVELAGTVSGGTMPIIYARGNHETRGDYASELLDALGLNEFYYQTEIGDISFVVLDSGEDKDDSHSEYGGLNNYNDYRAKQVEWLKTVETESEKVVVLSHSWQISDVEPKLSETAWNELDRLGATLVISGHSHQCRFVGDDNEHEKEVMEKHPEIKAYMDGGNSGEDYIASKLTISESEILIEAYTDSGEKVFDEKVNWNTGDSSLF